MSALDEFRALMERNRRYAKEFNEYAAQHGVSLSADQTRVDLECGWMMIRYVTIDAAFGYTVEATDHVDRPPHYGAALRTAKAVPATGCSTTSMTWTDAEKERYRLAYAAADKIKPPLWKADAA